MIIKLAHVGLPYIHIEELQINKEITVSLKGEFWSSEFLPILGRSTNSARTSSRIIDPETFQLRLRRVSCRCTRTLGTRLEFIIWQISLTSKASWPDIEITWWCEVTQHVAQNPFLAENTPTIISTYYQSFIIPLRYTVTIAILFWQSEI